MDGCRVVRSSDPASTRQGPTYEHALSAESVGAVGISMHLGAIPPGLVGTPHKHDGHETAIYVLSGRAGVDYGDGLEHRVEAEAGGCRYHLAGRPPRPLH